MVATPRTLEVSIGDRVKLKPDCLPTFDDLNLNSRQTLAFKQSQVFEVCGVNHSRVVLKMEGAKDSFSWHKFAIAEVLEPNENLHQDGTGKSAARRKKCVCGLQGDQIELPFAFTEAQSVKLPPIEDEGCNSPLNVLGEISRPAFRQYGGKWQLSDWILSHFPTHTIYVEPFGGAFSVGLRKAPIATEVYNDLHADAVNFFQQLQLRPASLIAAIAASPRTKTEFERCQEPTSDPLEWARRYYLNCQMSRAGGGGRWCSGASSVRLGQPQYDDSHLWAIAKRLRNVQIFNRDALDIIRQYDSPDALFYVDPPYPHQSRRSKDNRHQDQVNAQPRRQYRHEMKDEHHHHLAEVLHHVQGAVIISGYNCPLYEELYQGWQRVEKLTRTGINTEAIESLWLSPHVLGEANVLGGTTYNFHQNHPPEHRPLLHEQLASLEQERTRILGEGQIAPDGAWIETSRVPGRPPDWRQAFWRSSEPILDGVKGGKCKKRYIGKTSSSVHQQAISAVARRKQLRCVEKQIKLIQEELGDA
jgi:DNA adenine methylase